MSEEWLWLVVVVVVVLVKVEWGIHDETDLEA